MFFFYYRNGVTGYKITLNVSVFIKKLLLNNTVSVSQSLKKLKHRIISSYELSTISSILDIMQSMLRYLDWPFIFDLSAFENILLTLFWLLHFTIDLARATNCRIDCQIVNVVQILQTTITHSHIAISISIPTTIK